MLKLLIICLRGNMYMENEIGPETDPWETPHGITAESDRSHPQETDIVLSERQEEKRSNAGLRSSKTKSEQ